MHYILYQITNLVNNKIYVGVHKTKDLNDGYMGSGKVIKRAIKKHGLENFIKVILEQFDNSAAMYAREKEIVNEEFLSRKDIYNLRRGGYGGFEYINANPDKFLTEKRLNSLMPIQETKKMWLIKYENDSKFREEIRQNLIRANKISHELHGSSFKKLNKDATFQEKRKKKFKEINHQQGETNSQFGKCWIYFDMIGSKSIKKELLPLYIDQGWCKGRKNLR